MATESLTKFLTVAQTARRLRCSAPIVRKAIRTGKLRAVWVGPRVIRVPLSALDDMARGNGKGRNSHVPKRRPRKTVAK